MCDYMKIFRKNLYRFSLLCFVPSFCGCDFTSASACVQPCMNQPLSNTPTKDDLDKITESAKALAQICGVQQIEIEKEQKKQKTATLNAEAFCRTQNNYKSFAKWPFHVLEQLKFHFLQTEVGNFTKSSASALCKRADIEKLYNIEVMQKFIPAILNFLNQSTDGGTSTVFDFLCGIDEKKFQANLFSAVYQIMNGQAFEAGANGENADKMKKLKDDFVFGVSKLSAERIKTEQAKTAKTEERPTVAKLIEDICNANFVEYLFQPVPDEKRSLLTKLYQINQQNQDLISQILSNITENTNLDGQQKSHQLLKDFSKHFQLFMIQKDVDTIQIKYKIYQQVQAWKQQHKSQPNVMQQCQDCIKTAKLVLNDNYKYKFQDFVNSIADGEQGMNLSKYVLLNYIKEQLECSYECQQQMFQYADQSALIFKLHAIPKSSGLKFEQADLKKYQQLFSRDLDCQELEKIHNLNINVTDSVYNFINPKNHNTIVKSCCEIVDLILAKSEQNEMSFLARAIEILNSKDTKSSMLKSFQARNEEVKQEHEIRNKLAFVQESVEEKENVMQQQVAQSNATIQATNAKVQNLQQQLFSMQQIEKQNEQKIQAQNVEMQQLRLQLQNKQQQAQASISQMQSQYNLCWYTMKDAQNKVAVLSAKSAQWERERY